MINMDSLSVVLGKHNIRTWAHRSTLRDIQNMYVHPDYIKPSDADIAIIKMVEPVTYTSTIKAICLWAEDDTLDKIVGKEGTVAGWGRDENNNQYVDEARQLSFPIVTQEVCLRSDERFLKLTSNRTLCAGKVNYLLHTYLCFTSDVKVDYIPFFTKTNRSV